MNSSSVSSFAFRSHALCFAAELLRNSTALVKEVAAELGFTNPFHFSRVFKRVHAMPPEYFARIAQRM
jgi:AraC-like DNA-binding protein